MIYKHIKCIRLGDTGNTCDKCCKWNVKLSSGVVHWYPESILPISAAVPIFRLKNIWCRCLNVLIIYRRWNDCYCLKYKYHQHNVKHLKSPKSEQLLFYLQTCSIRNTVKATNGNWTSFLSIQNIKTNASVSNFTDIKSKLYK